MKWPLVWRRTLYAERHEDRNEIQILRLAARDRTLEIDALRTRLVELERNNATLSGHLTGSTAHVNQLAQMLHDLTRQLVELKREGFMPPPPTGEITSMTAPPDVVMAAIGERAAEGTELYRALVKYATTELRKEGADPAAIADRILRGAEEDIFELL